MTTTASTDESGLLTVQEVADAMRVSSMTIYRLIKTRELPATRVGSRLRVRRGDLFAYLDHHTTKGGAPWHDA